MMESQKLIKGCRERFKELNECKELSFDEEVYNIVKWWITHYKTRSLSFTDITDEVDFFEEIKNSVGSQIQRIPANRWKDFYHGWLEGRVDLLNNK